MEKKRNLQKAYPSCTYESPVGELTLAAGDDGLKGLWLQGQKYHGASLDAPMSEPLSCAQLDSACPAEAHLKAACAWLDDYFAGKNPSLDRLTLKPIGSEFRQVIWQLLIEIPLGETRSYGDLAAEAAKRMGKEHMASLAVGGAVGHNPISIIIPCHRVVGADGSLTGYAGGINKKLWLLKHEGAPTERFYVPAKSTAP